AGLEAKGLNDGVDPGGRVRDERQALGVCAEDPGHGRARAVEQARQVAAQEPYRLVLETVAQRPLDGQDRLRARPVRAVVEERDGRIEPPAEAGPHNGMTGVSMRSPDAATRVGWPGA